MFYAAARRRSLLTCSRRFSIRPQASAHLLLVRSSCFTCCCIVVCFASVHSELVTVSPSRVVDCHADLLRHPWTVGLGDPAEFDQLISQMDETMVHDETVAQNLQAMVGSGSTCHMLRAVPLPASRRSLCDPHCHCPRRILALAGIGRHRSAVGGWGCQGRHRRGCAT
jgi:hypothetical protein